MTMRKVLDSYSVIAYLENEPGAEAVGEFIKQARDKERPLLLSVVNWGEVYYIVHRTAGKEVADKAAQTLETLPIEVVDADREITRVAATLKAAHKMSYADCFAAALAKLEKADLVSGDKEFKEVEKEIKVVWL
ncbi:MAG: type II toxin-antitoxin system VapC family toxin [Elusimicrobia bacterium]|nr:type II toxin-antitoxin system VapC family toxin [Elusimicrobiota bacterium]